MSKEIAYTYITINMYNKMITRKKQQQQKKKKKKNNKKTNKKQKKNCIIMKYTGRLFFTIAVRHVTPAAANLSRKHTYIILTPLNPTLI